MQPWMRCGPAGAASSPCSSLEPMPALRELQDDAGTRDVGCTVSPMQGCRRMRCKHPLPSIPEHRGGRQGFGQTALKPSSSPGCFFLPNTLGLLLHKFPFLLHPPSTPASPSLHLPFSKAQSNAPKPPSRSTLCCSYPPTKKIKLPGPLLIKAHRFIAYQSHV